MAFEALSNAAQLKSNMVIVLNDNKMSIAPNVGGMSNYLGKIRTNQKYRNLKENVEQALDRIPNLGQPIAMRVKKAKVPLFPGSCLSVYQTAPHRGNQPAAVLPVCILFLSLSAHGPVPADLLP